jgi:hypothetical protein
LWYGCAKARAAASSEATAIIAVENRFIDFFS